MKVHEKFTHICKVQVTVMKNSKDVFGFTVKSCCINTQFEMCSRCFPVMDWQPVQGRKQIITARVGRVDSWDN